MSYKDLSISERTVVAVQAALSAGELIKGGFGSHFQVDSKEGKHNLVTEYDHKSEKLLHSFIKEAYPEDSFLSEEGGHLSKGTSGIEWVIDPLDGTVNYAHGIPMFAVSVAARRGKEILLGVIFQPITNELFIAEKNKGAFLNGKRLKVTDLNVLSDAILATGFPYNVTEDPLRCIEKFTEFLRQGIPIRRIGVATIDLTYLAAGRFDGFFEVSLKPWDLAAGVLVLEEAGGRVSDWFGNPLDIDKDQSILCTNGLIHDQMIEVLSHDH